MLVAPHGLQNLGGVSTLIYASDVLMIIIEIQIHCIYYGGALYKFWGSKALNSYIFIKD